MICLTLAINYLTRKIPAFQAVILGTLITSLSWLILAFWPTVWGAVLSLFVLAIGEIIQAPRYYEYISRLAPPGQQGTYMGFAFLPIGIGSMIGGWFGGTVVHRFGEVPHQPALIWWSVTAVGLATAVVLWIYDRIVRTSNAPAKARANLAARFPSQNFPAGWFIMPAYLCQPTRLPLPTSPTTSGVCSRMAVPLPMPKKSSVSSKRRFSHAAGTPPKSGKLPYACDAPSCMNRDSISW